MITPSTLPENISKLWPIVKWAAGVLIAIGGVTVIAQNRLAALESDKLNRQEFLDTLSNRRFDAFKDSVFKAHLRADLDTVRKDVREIRDWMRKGQQ